MTPKSAWNKPQVIDILATVQQERAGNKKKWWIAAGIVVLVILAVGGGLEWWVWSSRTRLKEQAIQEMEERFKSKLEIKEFQVDLFPAVRFEATGLSFRHHGRTDIPPLISIDKVVGTGNLVSLLTSHYLDELRLTKLHIQVPPRKGGVRQPKKDRPSSKGPKATFQVGTIIADGTLLQILPKEEGHDPLDWEIHELTLKSVSNQEPMSFRAVLTNGKPVGLIHSDGLFGPWAGDEPGDTPVSGHYTFDNADLSIFKGIAGILSSTGNYDGQLDRILVHGETRTPDFRLSISGNPLALNTKFESVVDGTNGDTILNSVDATFGQTKVHAQGAVAGKVGQKGKTIQLDITTTGRLEDHLLLATKGKPAMSGALSYRAKMLLPPGDQDVVEKLQLQGTFLASKATFRKLNVQEKLEKLSDRASGNPKDGLGDYVASNFSGRFQLSKSILSLPDTYFEIPGARVNVQGDYGLKDQDVDFTGVVKTDAKLSQMTTGWKSFLLKVADPLFKGKDAGAVIPIKISGSPDDIHVGLQMGKVFKKK